MRIYWQLGEMDIRMTGVPQVAMDVLWDSGFANAALAHRLRCLSAALSLPIRSATSTP